MTQKQMLRGEVNTRALRVYVCNETCPTGLGLKFFQLLSHAALALAVRPVKGLFPNRKTQSQVVTQGAEFHPRPSPPARAERFFRQSEMKGV